MRVIRLLRMVPIICSLSLATAYAEALVDGHCYLEGAADHAGTTVVFEASSPTAVTDSTTTDVTGAYAAGLSEGVYSVRFHHDGYLDQALPGTYALGTGSQTLPDATLEAAGDISVSGSVAGTWSAGLTCDVAGDIFVDEGDTLNIEPGVRIRFLGSYGFEVYGTLFAVGAEGDSIRFTSNANPPAPGDWKYVKFLQGYPSGVSSHGEIRYCVFEYGGVDVVNGHQGLLEMESWTYPLLEITVERSAFRHSSTNGIGMENANGTFSDNLIEENDWRGMAVVSSAPAVNGNVVRNNGSNGITIINASSSGASITGNVITGNVGEGIDCGSTSPTIVGNTLAGNQDGVKVTNGSPVVERNIVLNNTFQGIICTTSGSPVLRNNVVRGQVQYGIYTTSGVSPDIMLNVVISNRWGLGLASAPTQLVYNDVWNNTDYDYGGSGLPPQVGVVLTVNANGDPCDGYYNISLDPEFVGPDDFHLQASSPCIDAGPDSLPDPDGTRADIGAYYFDQSSTAVPILDPTSVPRLVSNAPNPFNPQTTIRYELPFAAGVRLGVYDVEGRLVRTLIAGMEIPAGRRDAVWNGRDDAGREVASGVYFCRLEAGRYRGSIRMTLVK